MIHISIHNPFIKDKHVMLHGQHFGLGDARLDKLLQFIIHNVVLWVMTPYSPIGGYQQLRGTPLPTYNIPLYNNTKNYNINLHCHNFRSHIYFIHLWYANTLTGLTRTTVLNI